MAEFAHELPLKPYYQHSGILADDSVSAQILSIKDNGLIIGVFFDEISTGCACSDDPDQAEILIHNYAELTIVVDINTNKVQIK